MAIKMNARRRGFTRIDVKRYSFLKAVQLRTRKIVLMWRDGPRRLLELGCRVLKRDPKSEVKQDYDDILCNELDLQLGDFKTQQTKIQAQIANARETSIDPLELHVEANVFRQHLGQGLTKTRSLDGFVF